jgi:methionyl-tRNA synthetase
MITQYNNKIVPEPKVCDQEETDLIESCNKVYNECVKFMKDQRVGETINAIFALIRQANKYIDITEPWKLSKDSSKKDKLDTVLYTLSETIRIATVLLQAFLIDIPSKIFTKFNTSADKQTFESIKNFDKTNFGQSIDKGENLFPRLDVEKEIAFLDTPNAPVVEQKKEEPKNEDKANTVDFINFDDFLKVKLLTGKIVNSEKVEGADKLLKNTVEIGKETRTIVSGIAKYYKPEEIIGKTVVVVSNLAPRKLRGIESQGMLLCAVDEEKDTLSLITVDKEMASGLEVC